MMKLILSLTLVWAFSSTAGAIQCHRCVDVNDLDCRLDRVEECRPGEICLNAFITETDGTQRIYRDCASSQVCPSVGPLTISSNVGSTNTVANASCCDTDECNDGRLEYFEPQAENGKFCGACDPVTGLCDSRVNCVGEEDTCFRATVLLDRAEMEVRGCGTPNVCDIAVDIRSLPFIEEAGTVLSAECYLFSTTTTLPPTTTTTTPEPTTTTTPEPTTTTTPEPTTIYTLSPEFFAKAKFLVEAVRQLSAQINLESLKQKETVLFQLHLKLLDDQSKLLEQQGGLPFDDNEQLPLHYQQCLLVNNHQLLLQQIHYSLCSETHLLELFSKQQMVLHQLQELLQSHHHHLLPHYAGHLQHYCDHE